METRARDVTLKENLRQAVTGESRDTIRRDFADTFRYVGLRDRYSYALADTVIWHIINCRTLKEMEAKIHREFESARVGIIPFLKALNIANSKRNDIMIGQVSPHVAGIKGKVLDFGAGSGELAQSLNDLLGLDMEAVDLKDFRKPGITIPFKILDGKTVPVSNGYYEAALSTAVLHHDDNNEDLLKELSRIARNRLVVIETIPENETLAAWQRTFATDVLWNRFFHNADIPVPGTYEMPYGWVRRFGQYGWKQTHSEDLGYDQPIAKVKHHLLVLARD